MTDRVRNEFPSFDRFGAWFGLGHKLEAYEPRLGGRIQPSVEIDGAKRPFGGSILIFEPAHELSFSNNWESDGWPVPTLITLRLTPLYDACHIELFHHGFERLGSDAGSRATKRAGTLAISKRSRESSRARLSSRPLGSARSAVREPPC